MLCKSRLPVRSHHLCRRSFGAHHTRKLRAGIFLLLRASCAPRLTIHFHQCNRSSTWRTANRFKENRTSGAHRTGDRCAITVAKPDMYTVNVRIAALDFRVLPSTLQGQDSAKDQEPLRNTCLNSACHCPCDGSHGHRRRDVFPQIPGAPHWRRRGVRQVLDGKTKDSDLRGRGR